MECLCCFTETQFKGSVLCDGTESHVFCNVCITGYADSLIGGMKGNVKCMSVDECSGTINDHWLALSIGEEKTRLLSRYRQMEDVRSALKGRLSSCPFCDIPIEVDNEDHNNIMECPNKECRKSSCLKCKREYHGEGMCPGSTDERIIREEAATYSVVRPCPSCHVEINRSEGCDHMVCPCGTTFCYNCMEDITNREHPYKCTTGTPRRRTRASRESRRDIRELRESLYRGTVLQPSEDTRIDQHMSSPNLWHPPATILSTPDSLTVVPINMSHYYQSAAPQRFVDDNRRHARHSLPSPLSTYVDPRIRRYRA